MRPAILTAAAVPYDPPQANGPLRLLVVGGSPGRAGDERLHRSAGDREARAGVCGPASVLTQQVREEDMARVRAVYDKLKINAELAPFFSDLPARLCLHPSDRLALRRRYRCRTRRDRPALDHGAAARCDRPGPVRQCRRARAGRWRDPHRAERVRGRLASEISGFAAEPARLAAMAANARRVGQLDAAERLADLVAKVAKI